MSQTRFIHYPFRTPFDALAQNLANSLDPTHQPPEYLRTARDLAAFLRFHGIEAGSPAAADLEDVRRLRARTRAVFAARSTTEAVRLVNRLLAGAPLAPRLVAARGEARIDWQAGAGTLAEQLRGAVAINLASLIERFGVERFRRCDASPCEDVFVDTSKGGARRYCGAGCANRTHVAQFRERQRSNA